MGSVVALAGQVGGAKLADGLYRLRGPALTVVVNTGDDYEHLGLSFSPDIDTMLYTLAGIGSAKAGWEPEGETHAVHAMLKALGGPDRPIHGDRSLAAPLLRAEGLASGRSLSEITLSFCRSLGIAARVQPMSDDRVRTYVLTEEGAVTFQDYFMQLGCEPAVRGFQYAGADEARIPDGVIEALHAEDLEAVILCPANPYHVIRPILEIEGMKELLLKRGAPVIAVTPIIGDRAPRGPPGRGAGSPPPHSRGAPRRRALHLSPPPPDGRGVEGRGRSAPRAGEAPAPAPDYTPPPPPGGARHGVDPIPVQRGGG